MSLGPNQYAQLPMTCFSQYPQMPIGLSQYAQMARARQMFPRSIQYEQPLCHTTPTPTHVLQQLVQWTTTNNATIATCVANVQNMTTKGQSPACVALAHY